MILASTSGGWPRGDVLRGNDVPWLVGSCISLAVAVALWGSTAAEPRALAASMAFGVVAATIVRREVRRWGVIGIGSPLSLTAVSWFLFLAVAGLGALAEARHDPRLGGDPGNLVTALLVSLGSLVLVAIGYRIAVRGARAIRRYDMEPMAVTVGALYSVIAIGWAARLYLLEAGHFGFLSAGASYTGPTNRMVQLASASLTVALIVLVVALWSPSGLRGVSRTTARWLLIANVVPLTLTSLASGFKAQLVTELVPLGVTYVMIRARVPWRALAAIAAYLVFSYSGVETYRADILAGRLDESARSGAANAVGNSISRVVEGWASETPLEHVRSFWRHLTDEYADTLRNLAVILHRTPDEIPHLGNERLVRAPVFFLPTSTLGLEGFNLGRYMNVVYLNSTPTSSSPTTQPGDFFMSGGWPAVVIGELAVGLFIGGVWRLCVLRRRTLMGIVVYASTTAAFISAGLDWGTLSRGLLQLLGAAWLTMVLLQRRPSPAPAAA